MCRGAWSETTCLIQIRYIFMEQSMLPCMCCFLLAADTSLAENVVLEMTPSTALSRPVVSKLMSMTAVGRSSTLIDHGRHVERQPNSLSSQGTDTMPWFLLDPDGSLRTFWDGLMVLALFYTLIYMPLRVGMTLFRGFTWSV